MIENKFFAFLSRMKYINRWGLMHNSRFENLSEHSFETAYLAGALANIENTRFGGKYDASYITVCALYHDCAEIITGDMPTPVKYKTRGMTHSYSDAEREAQNLLMDSLDPRLKDVYACYFDPDPDSAKLIKAADKLSALIKCREEINIGNRDFVNAEQSIRETLERSGLASVRYFLEKVLDAYSLTLDELSR